MWKYRVDVPNLPKCPVRGWCTGLIEVSRTGIDVCTDTGTEFVTAVHTGTRDRY